MSNKTLLFLTALLAAQEASAFAPSTGSANRAIGGLRMADDAQALSDYMAKSHVEKLRAIKDVEDKKNSEIAVSLFCTMFFHYSFYQNLTCELIIISFEPICNCKNTDPSGT